LFAPEAAAAVMTPLQDAAVEDAAAVMTPLLVVDQSLHLSLLLPVYAGPL
jgi:hypothetical protein